MSCIAEVTRSDLQPLYRVQELGKFCCRPSLQSRSSWSVDTKSDSMSHGTPVQPTETSDLRICRNEIGDTGTRCHSRAVLMNENGRGTRGLGLTSWCWLWMWFGEEEAVRLWKKWTPSLRINGQRSSVIYENVNYVRWRWRNYGKQPVPACISPHPLGLHPLEPKPVGTQDHAETH